MFNSFKSRQNPTATATKAPSGPKTAQIKSLPQTSQLQRHLEIKSKLHEKLLDRLNLAALDGIEKSELRREVASFVTQTVAEEGMALRSDEIGTLIDELIHEVLGLGPLEPLLEDPTINDILVNNHETVYVERFGVLERVNTRFRDEAHLLRIIDKIVSGVGRRIDESNPTVDARLPDGSRVNAVIRPCAIDGPSISIRKFSKSPMTMEKLVQHHALSDDAAELLKAIVQARLNVLISGGTGSGKTTMLNAMSSFIGQTERIVTIEDAAEIQLQQEHVLRLESKPPNAEDKGAVTQRDLVRNALRMRPDRIVIGEVRGAETFDMLQAMNTGHDGSMTTIHANTARDALGRVEQMITMMGMELPLSTIRAQIASSVNVVVQLSRLSDGKRKVMSISEITGMENDVVTMQDIYVFKKQGRDADGNVLGEFMPTGIRPNCWDTFEAAGIEIDPGIISRGRFAA